MRNSFIQKAPLLVLCTGFVLVGTGCSKLKSRDELNQGVMSYKNSKYVDAVRHFRQAVELDPDNMNAQKYLATSYYIQWIPGADNPDNVKNHDMAAREFGSVLKREPNDPLALAMMASMSYNSATAGTPDQKDAALDEAKRWNLKRIEANPRESEPYYYLGVIVWSRAYAPIQAARASLKMAPTEPGPIKDPKVRAEMKAKYGQLLDEGIDSLHKCLSIDKENDEAMTYINLLLRKKADIEDSADAAKADIAQAEDWANKAVDTKRIKATHPQKAAQES